MALGSPAAGLDPGRASPDGGVLAGTFDRRRLLLVVQGGLVLTGMALTILTIAGQMPPALLLTLTFLLGAGSAFSVPAYQAIIPDLVSCAQLPSSSALGAMKCGLYRDGEVADRFVEFFVVPWWEEHLRQHRERQTGSMKSRPTPCLTRHRRRDIFLPSMSRTDDRPFSFTNLS